MGLGELVLVVGVQVLYVKHVRMYVSACVHIYLHVNIYIVNIMVSLEPRP